MYKKGNLPKYILTPVGKWHVQTGICWSHVITYVNIAIYSMQKLFKCFLINKYIYDLGTTLSFLENHLIFIYLLNIMYFIYSLLQL